jgi:hypothetical protein
MIARKETRTSKTVGDTHYQEVILHNENEKNFLCIRRSDKKTIIVPRHSIVNFKTQFLHGDIEVWRIFLSESKDLVKVVILDRDKLRSREMEAVHVNCPASDYSICEIPGWKQEVGSLSAASINRLVRNGINHANADSKKTLSPSMGIEFISPSIKQPPKVWVMGSAVTIRWISWVRNAGTSFDVSTVKINLVKCNSNFTRICESNYPVRVISRFVIHFTSFNNIIMIDSCYG